MEARMKTGMKTKNGSMCTAVALVLVIGSLTLPAWNVIENGAPESSIVKVLHVYACDGYDEVEEVLEIAGATSLFDVSEVSLEEFKDGTPSDLSGYDVLTFGISDCYDGRCDISRLDELRIYIEAGGGIVFTHDSLEWVQKYGPIIEEPAGVENVLPDMGEIRSEVEILLDHQMIHEPFELGDVGDSIPVQETHNTGGVVTTADIVMDFSDLAGGVSNFYLTAHEWISGRVAVIELGNSEILDCQCTFSSWPDVPESEIFTNTVWWAGRGVSPSADAGPEQTVNEGDLVQFDGTGSSGYQDLTWDFNDYSDSDGDGDYTNDVDETGPTPTHVYGDNGVYTVTLRATCQQGQTDIDTMIVTVLNVPPSLVGDVKAYARGDVTLRIAGEKWHSVNMTLYEGGVEIGGASVTRSPGSPNDQAVTVEGLTLDMMGGGLSATVEYTPLDDPINGQVGGASPAWLIFTPQGGEEVRLHHNFNVKHPDTWLWTVDDFRPFLIGVGIAFEATATDPGSDDLEFVWDWDDGSTTSTVYYNDGVGPDPYPSSDVNPITVTDVQTHAYGASGTYSVTLMVEDDDGGTVVKTLSLTI